MSAPRRRGWFPDMLGRAIIAAALTCAPTAEAGAAGSSSPDPAAGSVLIRRDDWGVPSIYARTIPQGYFGLGYAQAQDRGEILYVSILAARGTLAEVVTPDELLPAIRMLFGDVEAMVENDYRARLWRIREKAADSTVRLDPEVRAAYDAFIAGLNAFARRHPDQVPAWAPSDITVADLVAIGHWPLWYGYQAEQGLAECRRAGAPSLTARSASAPGESRGFSNQWAVMGVRTAGGSPILLSDPHGGIDSQSFEYRIHAGALHSAGFAQGPLLILGRNREIGWALTTGSPDVSDCYRIVATGSENSAYRLDGAELPIERERSVIRIKGGTEREVALARTRHNGVLSPVVRELPGIIYVVSTPYIEELEGLHNAVYRMNFAKSVDQFRAAIGRGLLFPQNLLVADTRGDILYLRAGLTPRRAPGIDPLVALDGNSRATLWQGLHDGRDLLAIRSPAAGYLQNNNVNPRWMMPVRPAQLAGMPAYLIDDGASTEPTSRSVAALNALSANAAMTAEEARALATGITLPDEHRWIAMLHVAIGTAGAPGFPAEPLRAFADDLLSFDGRLAAESTSALKYVYVREAFRQGLTPVDAANVSAAFDDPEALSPALRKKMVGAVEQAFERMQRTPQGTARRYGDEFRLEVGPGVTVQMSGGSLRSRGAPFSECSIRERLCGTTLLAMMYTEPDAHGQRMARYGSRIMRLDLFSPSGIRSFSLQNPGQSERGTHQFDQAARLLSRLELKPIRFEWADLRDHVSSEDVVPVTD